MVSLKNIKQSHFFELFFKKKRMAPEVIQGLNEASFASDIWSLVLFNSIFPIISNGIFPIKGISAIEIAEKVPPHFSENPMRVREKYLLFSVSLIFVSVGNV